MNRCIRCQTRILRFAAVGLFLAGLAVAQEPPPQTPATAASAAAEEVLAAFAAGDGTALKALADRDEPDPWLVADELVRRGEHDTAAAFAAAAPRPAVELLPAYVRSRGEAEPETGARKRLASVKTALQAGDLRAAIARAGVPQRLPATVVTLQLAHARGLMAQRSGALAESAKILRDAAAVARSLGWRALACQMLSEGATSAWNHGDRPAAEAALEECLELRKTLGDRAGMIFTLVHLGNVRFALADARGSLTCHQQALRLGEELGDRRGVAVALVGIGRVHRVLGEWEKALSCFERALPVLEGLGERGNVAAVLGNIGTVHESQGAWGEALSCYERSLALREEVDDRRGAASALASIGNVHRRRGDFAKALSFLQRSLALSRELGDRFGVEECLRDLGTVHLLLGEYPLALSCYERSLALGEELGDPSGVATTLGNLGTAHLRLGDHRRAVACYERSLALLEKTGDVRATVAVLVNLGAACQALGALPQAVNRYESALEILTRLGSREGVAVVLGNLGNLRADRGDHEEALALYERSLALREELGDRLGIADARGRIGILRAKRGESAEAVRLLDRSLREARRLRVPELELILRISLARARLQAGEPARALMTAEQGLQTLEGMLGGLGEEEGGMARAKYVNLFGVGALAAARLGEAAEVLKFLESGRAGSLLETLGGGRATRFADLPPELIRAEREARDREAAAHREHRLSLDRGNRAEIRETARAVDLAMEERREVVARIQREAKRVAGVFYPRAATIEEIEGWLPDGTALVLYGLCLDEALALVLTSDGERIVDLGTAAELEGATGDGSPRLGELLAAPLELGPEIDTVLVSPEGPLCYVPWGALFPDRAVAVVPSGTTYVLLREEERESGEGVLALGDPDYEGADPGAQAIYWRGRSLAPLPASRAEAEEVGTTVLLGKQASEAGFRETVSKRRRWRAVHLAGHGLIDAERPTLSSLALSGTEEDDGFLTALEVLRMEIPADLAVLSACETAKGKVVKGEGIVGLTRAFMYAGAPRVLCSLWKVDDAATKALMVKFYELWNPPEGQGLGAAEALRGAQAFVRGHEEWKNPDYWAAWVLWGLP